MDNSPSNIWWNSNDGGGRGRGRGRGRSRGRPTKSYQAPEEPGIIGSILGDLLGCDPALYFLIIAMVVVCIHELINFMKSGSMPDMTDFSSICSLCCGVVVLTCVIYAGCLGFTAVGIPKFIVWLPACLIMMSFCSSIYACS
jgi:hypothetical protein